MINKSNARFPGAQRKGIKMKEIIIEDWKEYIDEPEEYRDYESEMADWLDEKGRLCLTGENGDDYRDEFERQWAGLMNEDFYNEFYRAESENLFGSLKKYAPEYIPLEEAREAVSLAFETLRHCENEKIYEKIIEEEGARYEEIEAPGHPAHPYYAVIWVAERDEFIPLPFFFSHTRYRGPEGTILKNENPNGFQGIDFPEWVGDWVGSWVDKKCLWQDGDNYFWADRVWEPRHGDYGHSRQCPCVTGLKVEWSYDGNRYVPEECSGPAKISHRDVPGFKAKDLALVSEK